MPLIIREWRKTLQSVLRWEQRLALMLTDDQQTLAIVVAKVPLFPWELNLPSILGVSISTTTTTTTTTVATRNTGTTGTGTAAAPAATAKLMAIGRGTINSKERQSQKTQKEITKPKTIISDVVVTSQQQRGNKTAVLLDGTNSNRSNKAHNQQRIEEKNMTIGTKQHGTAGVVAPAVSSGQKRKAPPTPDRDNRRMAAAVASLESYSDVEILEEIAEDAEDEAEREFNSPPHVPPPSPVMSKREKDVVNN